MSKCVVSTVSTSNRLLEGKVPVGKRDFLHLMSKPQVEKQNTEVSQLWFGLVVRMRLEPLVLAAGKWETALNHQSALETTKREAERCISISWDQSCCRFGSISEATRNHRGWLVRGDNICRDLPESSFYTNHSPPFGLFEFCFWLAGVLCHKRFRDVCLEMRDSTNLRFPYGSPLKAPGKPKTCPVSSPPVGKPGSSEIGFLSSACLGSLISSGKYIGLVLNTTTI